VTPATHGFPALLQEFFQRLVTERGVSAHTIASYRDTFERSGSDWRFHSRHIFVDQVGDVREHLSFDLSGFMEKR